MIYSMTGLQKTPLTIGHARGDRREGTEPNFSVRTRDSCDQGRRATFKRRSGVTASNDLDRTRNEALAVATSRRTPLSECR